MRVLSKPFCPDSSRLHGFQTRGTCLPSISLVDVLGILYLHRPHKPGSCPPRCRHGWPLGSRLYYRLLVVVCLATVSYRHLLYASPGTHEPVTLCVGNVSWGTVTISSMASRVLGRKNHLLDIRLEVPRGIRCPLLYVFPVRLRMPQRISMVTSGSIRVSLGAVCVGGWVVFFLSPRASSSFVISREAYFPSTHLPTPHLLSATLCGTMCGPKTKKVRFSARLASTTQRRCATPCRANWIPKQFAASRFLLTCVN